MPSWTAPITWTFKQIPTFTVLNAELRDKLLFFKTLFDDSAAFSWPVATTLTLSSNVTGAITPTQNLHAVDTNAAAAAGDLATLTIAGSIRAGVIVRLTAANIARVVTVRSGTGNLFLKKGDFALNAADRWIELMLVGTTWYEIGRSDLNGAVLTSAELKNYVETFSSPAISAGALTLDLSAGCEFAVSLNAAITSITISNVPSTTKVTTLTIKFVADGTVRAITWPASFKWASGTAPTMTGTNTKVDIVTARTYDGGTTWYPAVYTQAA